MKEYYDVLGLNENATNEEIEIAYKTLKAKYSNDRFLEGEKGNEAARNLTKLETAYSEIMSEKNNESKDASGNTYNFEQVENLIKEGKLSDAQSILDDISERNAEWHYLQSVLFYKKSWITESKKQLEIALNMEPNNPKYAESYTKLKQKIEFNEKQFHSGNSNYQSAPRDNRQMGGDGINDCFSFCATWCCMDMLCSMCCR